MQGLNARDSRVRLVVAREFLEPLVGDRRPRTLRDLSKWKVRLREEVAGLAEEVGHDGQIIGKYFPPCQGTLSRMLGKESPMTQRSPPRKTLARNLRLLMDAAGMKAPEVARRSGVDPKTVNNMIHGRYDPRPEKADQVASVFGLRGWQLLIPDLPADMLRNGGLERLIENYVSAGPEGRDSITRVAEMAAKYEKA